MDRAQVHRASLSLRRQSSMAPSCRCYRGLPRALLSLCGGGWTATRCISRPSERWRTRETIFWLGLRLLAFPPICSGSLIISWQLCRSSLFLKKLKRAFANVVEARLSLLLVRRISSYFFVILKRRLGVAWWASATKSALPTPATKVLRLYGSLARVQLKSYCRHLQFVGRSGLRPHSFQTRAQCCEVMGTVCAYGFRRRGCCC